jgi:hypothetical protein
MLVSLPGNFPGGVLVAAYSPGMKVAIYYDQQAGAYGGTELIMTLDNLTDVRSLSAADFHFLA